MADRNTRVFRTSRGTSEHGEFVANAQMRHPDATQMECVHPQCFAKPQVRYEFPIPLCGRHLVGVLSASIEVTRAAKMDYSKSNPGKRSPLGVKARIPHDQVIYYVRFGDRVKIGTTRDLKSRLLNLPYDELLATEPGGVELEKRRHQQFADSLVSGREWFGLSPALLAHIKALKAS